jgi:hypothetical protein
MSFWKPTANKTATKVFDSTSNAKDIKKPQALKDLGFLFSNENAS